MNMRENYIQLRPIPENLVKHTFRIKGVIVSVYSNKESLFKSILSNTLIKHYSISTSLKEDFSIIAILDPNIVPKGSESATGFIPKQEKMYVPGVENHFYSTDNTSVTVLYYPAPSILINYRNQHSIISGTETALIYHSRMAFKQIITRVYYSQGYYPLHASCVCKGEQAYLFIGKTHSGKTTIMLNMAACGYIPMNDDMVFLSLIDNRLRVESIPTRPQIRLGSSDYLISCINDDVDIGNIDVYDSFGFCNQASIEAVLIPQIGYDKTAILPADPQNYKADLLRAFMAHQKIPVDTDFARLFYSFLELRFYELQLGSDMLYLKEWLDHDAEAYC